MNKIAMIHAKIRSISPLHIGDGEGEILLDNDSNTAYLPATSVAGSFRAYLRAEGEDDISLFGYQEEEKGGKSLRRPKGFDLGRPGPRPSGAAMQRPIPLSCGIAVPLESPPASRSRAACLALQCKWSDSAAGK